MTTPTPCTEDCCAEIISTICVKHEGERLLSDIVLQSIGTYQIQALGGINGSDLTTTVQKLIDVLTLIKSKTYDLSAIGGAAGVDADTAINYLITKILAEHP